MPRQLTAIMFADMVGYTALMQEDERRAKLLRDRQREVLEERVAEFGGEIIQYYGDGALCGFQSAIQAVECAVAIQVDLREEPQVPVRIGIHLGDVAFDKTGVYGDGVNIASRIESLSVPGGVLVSEKVADEVKNQPGISTEFLAEVALKNVRDPQRVFAVTNEDLVVPGPKEVRGWKKAGGQRPGDGRRRLMWVAGVVAVGVVLGVVYALSSGGEGPGPGELVSTPLSERPIAILPFSCACPEEHRWLGEAMTMNLAERLSGGIFLPVDIGQVQALFQRLQSEGLGGPSLYQRVAEGVGVDLVLHGGVTAQPDGNLSGNLSLYDVRSRETVGPLSERGEVDGFLDMVERLSLALYTEWSDADPSFLEELPTTSMEAQRVFYEGLYEFRAGNYTEAETLFRDAIQADSNFAMAHYRLSHAALWAWDWDQARWSVDDAWSLSADLSPLTVRLLEAWRAFLKQDPVAAEGLYDQLYQEYPDRPEVLAGYGSVLAYYNSLRGRSSKESVPYFEDALEADPHYGEARYHVLDNAAKEGDQELFESLVGGVHPQSPQMIPFEALRAFRFGSPADQDSVVRRLEEEGGDPLVFAAGRVAATIHDFGGASRLGEVLSSRRGEGHRRAGEGLLAALGFAQGQWREADRRLSQLAEREMEWSLEMRALFSTFLWMLDRSSDWSTRLQTLRDSIQGWTPEEFVEPSYFNLFGPHSQHHQEFKLFLLGILSSALGDGEGARDYSGQLRDYGSATETRDLTFALSRSVDAHLAYAEGEPSQAESILAGIIYFPRFEFISASPFFSRALDRWLRGEVLRELGRPEDALAWFNTLSDGWGEFLFAGPAHLQQAQIHQEMADTASAIEHYNEFLRLWGEADPELQPLVESARSARDALAGEG